MRTHRQQPTRLPHPLDSPGKNTGVGCHFLLQCRKVKSESVRLFETPWTAAYQALPSMGFSRQEYWSGVPLPSLSIETILHSLKGLYAPTVSICYYAFNQSLTDGLLGSFPVNACFIFFLINVDLIAFSSFINKYLGQILNSHLKPVNLRQHCILKMFYSLSSFHLTSIYKTTWEKIFS